MYYDSGGRVAGLCIIVSRYIRSSKLGLPGYTTVDAVSNQKYQFTQFISKTFLVIKSPPNPQIQFCYIFHIIVNISELLAY